jgi:MFS family permease
VPSAPSRWWLLTVLTAAYGAGAFGVLGVSPLSPFFLAAFHLTRVEVGLLLPAVYLSGLLFSLPAGRMADRLGVRACLLGGLALAGAALGLGASILSFVALLGCLAAAGVGWSIVNPALGKAIIDLFPPLQRGVAMGIKQMGLTVGGVASALALPPLATALGWRGAIAVGAVVVAAPVALTWRALSGLEAPHRAAPADPGITPESVWWWMGRPALLVFFAAGLGLGMAQSALLGFLPLFATQRLGVSAVGAGFLLAVAQAGGALARVGLGMASDRWFGGRRTPWLVLTAGLAAASFAIFARMGVGPAALAGAVSFWAGVGSFGWVGLFLVIAAEVGGRTQAGLLTGVAMASILGGILVGAPLFGALLDATDSYAVAWTTFSLLSAAAATALAAGGRAIARERREG